MANIITGAGKRQNKQTNKQIQRQKTDKHLGRNHTKGINLKFTDLLRTHARGELNEK